MVSFVSSHAAETHSEKPDRQRIAMEWFRSTGISIPNRVKQIAETFLHRAELPHSFNTPLLPHPRFFLSLKKDIKRRGDGHFRLSPSLSRRSPVSASIALRIKFPLVLRRSLPKCPLQDQGLGPRPAQ